MKKTKNTVASSRMVRLPGNEIVIKNHLTVPQDSVQEPKSRILSWNWEPMHETYVFPKNVKGQLNIQKKMDKKMLKPVMALLIIFSMIIFSSCRKEEAVNPVTRNINVNGFDKIEMDDDHEIVVTQSATFSVQARGDAADVNELRATVTNGALNIEYMNDRSNRKQVHIYISMPVLKLANFNGASYGSVNGFSLNDKFQISLTGDTKFTVTANVSQFTVNVTGTSILTLNGSASKVMADISGLGQYFGYGISNTDTAFIWTSGEANAYVYADTQLTAEASGQSKIYFKGNPGQRILTASGLASITEQ